LFFCCWLEKAGNPAVSYHEAPWGRVFRRLEELPAPPAFHRSEVILRELCLAGGYCLQCNKFFKDFFQQGFNTAPALTVNFLDFMSVV
jgi:hypothetical protein